MSAGASAESGPVRHVYVHVPFCAHRCGYCDFVTVVGHEETHEAYVDALLAELGREAALLGEIETVFLGGGTPTLLAPPALARLLASLPAAAETTVEANPETVTRRLARLLAGSGVSRVSLGAQSFRPQLLELLERRARPEAVRRAYANLRDAGLDNISLDLLYGIPGQTEADLEDDLAAAVELGPDHLSCYELEAKPGTRFTHAHGAALTGQAELMEGYLERVVDVLVGAGYRWYETSSFAREGRESRHNLGYWLGHDYLGIGIGAVSTVGLRRWRNRPGLARYLAALAAGEEPPREVERLDRATRERERVMLGLRLDGPLELAGLDAPVDPGAVERMARAGLLEQDGGSIRLTRRGRLLGGGVTAEILAEIPA
ncbi:MAG: radical SAM family heme chaperone HemW [Gaiellales bacterium]